MKISAPASENSAAGKVYGLLQAFHTAMLVTQSPDGPMHARPMEIAHAGEDCHVWFFTNRRSGNPCEIRANQEVLLTFQKDHQKYLSLSGLARLITDRSMIETLWKQPFSVWFPGGLSDPSLTLVHVIPQQAEYWDNAGTGGSRYRFAPAGSQPTGAKRESAGGSPGIVLPG